MDGDFYVLFDRCGADYHDLGNMLKYLYMDKYHIMIL